MHCCRVIFRLVALAVIPLFGLCGRSYAQADRVVLSGVVVDTSGTPVPYAGISILNSTLGATTNERGLFRLPISKLNSDTILLVVSSLGYKSDTIPVLAGNASGLDGLHIVLRSFSRSIKAVTVRVNRLQPGSIERINVTDLGHIPSVTGGFESLLKSIPGVSSSNELSSQYAVRGGNFDENLVYVNDIEIFRPFLIRSGQQEGLSFVNPDMVASVKFSAGAFSAEYGDKMSSVLDVTYRKPNSFRTRVSASMLGANGATEGVLFNGRLSYITGVRYKTSRYMLQTLDSKGDYSPSFVDWQGLFSYRLGNRLTFSVLGNFSTNRFLFAPDVRETRFGVFTNTLQLKVYYQGQEVNYYGSRMGAAYFTYRPSDRVRLKLLAVSYRSVERETYDLLGQYFLNELDNNPNSSTYNDSLINVGVGGFLNHARNYLDARVTTLSHVGSFTGTDVSLKWGISWQGIAIADELNQWRLVDSSGFALPYTGNSVSLKDVVWADNRMNYSKVSAYGQLVRNNKIGDLSLSLNFGLRAFALSYRNAVGVSPRGAISVTHCSLPNMEFNLASGIYYQVPFYREFRRPDGTLNRDIIPQKSVQLLAGVRYYFNVWNRPFRLSVEGYRKWLTDLIPYRVEDVRITYSAKNMARGFVRGIDVKVNGELVKGAESWVGVSLLETREMIRDDSYVDQQGRIITTGYYPRPTDQRFRFNLFFQDYLPGNPTFRVHLAAFYGTGIPVGVEGNPRYDIYFRLPSYRRVDIGFTKIFLREGKTGVTNRKSIWGIRDIWLSAEVFNLFNFNNTISYFWVRTVANQEGVADSYAVPNYLTSRRVNLKLMVVF